MEEQSANVRRLSKADAALAEQVLTQINQRSVTQIAVREFLQDPSCYLMVAERDGTPVGTLNGYALRKPFRPEPQFLLYEIDVASAWRQRGIGKKLVSAFVDEARRCGAFEVWVLTERSNEAAVKMYGQCGLREENPAANTIMMNLLL